MNEFFFTKRDLWKVMGFRLWDVNKLDTIFECLHCNNHFIIYLSTLAINFLTLLKIIVNCSNANIAAVLPLAQLFRNFIHFSIL